MASSSSSKRKRRYDVFLSFRGTDVRNNFLGHLYTALAQNGLFTYIDSEELRKGEQISPALTKAIEESRVAIIVFSKDYASSAWCLEEVAKIMECKEQRDLMVFPVFYKVDPREVRTPRVSYREAMAEHEIKFGGDSEKVKRWKEALLSAGSLSGWHFPDDGYEAGLIQQIIQDISTQLDRMPLDVAKYPVGIDSRVQKLKTILNLRSKDDVLMVGLWGQGGVGKTTLAKAIYNAVFREFQGSCFLERVRENSKNSNDLVPLQEKLLSEVLPGKKSTVFSVGGGSRLIQERLCDKKVLIILDDVDDERQLNALARDCEWFTEGSRIIITTRNKHLLTYHGVDHIYEVKAFENGEAFELFIKHAFRRNQKIDIRSNLVDSVLYYAGGLPLALEVLGSFLCGRGEDEWESTLQKLTKSPDKKINDVLKVGYEALEDYAKEIFLDIACFFKGWYTWEIKKILDSCDFHTTIGVKVLIERSLISEENGTLQMHDLIQLMGRDIVEEECRDDSSKRSRLWLYDDVHNVLSGDVGTSAVKAIVLKLREQEEMYVGPSAFTNMKKLRLLILRNVHNSFQGPIHLPNELRWFEWPNCASIPEFGDGQKKLVGLELQNTNIEGVLKQIELVVVQMFLKNLSMRELRRHVLITLWMAIGDESKTTTSFAKSLRSFHGLPFNNPKARFKSILDLLLDLTKKIGIRNENPRGFINLKFLNFSFCRSLVCMPDLNFLPNLEELGLYQCENLQVAHESVGHHSKLRSLNLYGCSNLQHLCDVLQSTNLQNLCLSNCSKLQRFPDIPDKITRLKRLSCDGTSIKELPASIENLVSLEDMVLNDNKELAILPSSIYRLKNLGYLTLEGCSQLTKFPKKEEDLSDPHTETGFEVLSRLRLQGCNLSEVEFLENNSCFPFLKELELQENNFTNLPSCGHLYNLKELNVSYCKRLQEIHQIPPKLSNLSAISCESLRKIPSNMCEASNIDLSACYELISNGTTSNHLFKSEQLHTKTDCRVILPEGKMTEWLLPNKEGYLSFMASKDLCEKLVGLAFCLTFRKIKGLDVYFELEAFVNGKRTSQKLVWINSWDNDKVYLQFHGREQLWGVDPLGLNDWSHFQIRIRASHRVIANNCRFKLIFNSLENDLKVLLQHNQLLDSALLYELRHEDSPMSMEEDSPSKLVHEGLNMAHVSIEKHCYPKPFSFDRQNVCPGGEMPKEFEPVEGDTISFIASEDLYNKLHGLALCVVFGVEDGEKEVSFDIVPHINGQRRNLLSRTLGSFDSDHMWIQYLGPNELWGELEGGVDFGEFEGSYVRLSLELRVSGGTMKKLGYVIRCKRLKNGLKDKLEDEQLVDPAALHEDSKGDPYQKRANFFLKYHILAEDQESLDIDREVGNDSYAWESSGEEELEANESETD